MEQQSDKLRALLEQVKYDAPQTILPGLITHIEEDDPYAFFRYVQDLLEHRRIDELLLSNKELWAHTRFMYWERFQWLLRRDLKQGLAVPEEMEKRRRLDKALEKTFKGVPGNDYKEDWITEYLEANGLSWEDVANGWHLRMRAPGFPDPAVRRLHPRGMMQFVSRDLNVYEDKDDAGVEDDAPPGDDDEGPPPPPPPYEHGPDEEEDDNEEYQPALAKRAIAGEPLNTDDSQGSDHDNDEVPEDSCEKEDDEKTLSTHVSSLKTPNPSFDDSMGAPRRASAAVKPPASKKPPPERFTNEEWIPQWQKATRNGKMADFNQQPYKSWLSSGPILTLRRIANFLSDEDIDCTPGWAGHVAEIAEYLSYLIVNYDAEKHSWGYELREAIEMLRTHTVYEDYHYGAPPLTLHFDEAPVVSERLPPVEGCSVVVAQKPVVKDPLAPRNLLHRVPVGVWDAMYKTPRDALNATFLWELRIDERLYWTMVPPEVVHNRPPATEWLLQGTDRAIPVEQPCGFNMCHVEDDAFIDCMQQGPLRTHEELGKTCNFEFSEKAHEEEGHPKPMRNKQLLQFAKFRGASRAALTFALRTLGSQRREIKAVSSPWRRPVVRTPEQRRKKGYPGVIWQGAKLEADQVPKDEFDPMAYTFWHSMLLENQGSWAKTKIPDVEKARKTLVGRDRGKYPPVPKTNFKGPYTVVEVNEEQHNNEQLLRRLEKTLQDLETAARLSPRPLLKEVLIYAGWGHQGLPPAEEEEGMFLDDVVEKGEVRIMKDDDVDLELLERMSHLSANDKMLEPLPAAWSPRKGIFADRVQALLADISTASIFRSTEAKATLAEVVAAVNARGEGPVKGVQFTAGEASGHLDDLETFKRISVTRSGYEETTYSRPETTIHPEQTFHWDFHPFTRPRPAPTYLTYPALAEQHPQIKRMNQARTTPLLKGTAWRLGKTIAHLEVTLASRPTSTQAAFLRATYRDLTRNWERKVETQTDAGGARQAMDYRDVIRYAEPARFNPAWAPDDAEVEEGDVLGPVYAGTLREAHENKNMLWPSRWRRVASEDGEEVVWSRDGIWSWASPNVRGSWRYFNVRRWPVHLQSGEMQEMIRVSGERGRRCAVGAVMRGPVVPEESAAEGIGGARLGSPERAPVVADMGVGMDENVDIGLDESEEFGVDEGEEAGMDEDEEIEMDEGEELAMEYDDMEVATEYEEDMAGCRGSSR